MELPLPKSCERCSQNGHECFPFFVHVSHPLCLVDEFVSRSAEYSRPENCCRKYVPPSPETHGRRNDDLRCRPRNSAHQIRIRILVHSKLQEKTFTDDKSDETPLKNDSSQLHQHAIRTNPTRLPNRTRTHHTRHLQPPTLPAFRKNGAKLQPHLSIHGKHDNSPRIPTRVRRNSKQKTRKTTDGEKVK